MKWLVVLAILINQVSAFAASDAESCTPINQTETLGWPRIQGPYGWCYAYAAADLFSFQLKQKVSAAPIIFSSPAIHLKRPALKDTDAGNIVKALKYAIRDGLCLEENYESAGPRILERYHSDIQTFYRDLKKGCRDRVSAKGLKIGRDKTGGDLSKIDELLNAGNIIEASMDLDIYHQTEKPEWKVNHSALIVGRRFNEEKQRCEYLFRNAWAINCSGFRDDLDCTLGHVWMPEQDLKKAVIYTTYLTR